MTNDHDPSARELSLHQEEGGSRKAKGCSNAMEPYRVRFRSARYESALDLVYVWMAEAWICYLSDACT